MKRCTTVAAGLLAAALVLAGGPALALDADCLSCHKEMTTVTAGKPAQPIACVKCHETLDGRSTPHLNSGRFALGLGAKGADSCLQCHGKEDYANTRHGTLGSGCTGCHDTHAAKHGKLLKDEVVEVCYTCHKRDSFEGKVTHKPVAQGDCADCHAMHATEHPALLSDALVKGCPACHTKIKKQPHVTAGFSSKGHPVGGEKPDQMDPAQPAKPYYCGSCHHPHRSDERWMMRFDLSSPTGFCQKCHRI
jgi:predicted CXXCH cytochrome family protein